MAEDVQRPEVAWETDGSGVGAVTIGGDSLGVRLDREATAAVFAALAPGTPDGKCEIATCDGTVNVVTRGRRATLCVKFTAPTRWWAGEFGEALAYEC